MVVKNVPGLLEALEIVLLRPEVEVVVEKVVEIKDPPVRLPDLKDLPEAKIGDLPALPHDLRDQNKINDLKVKTVALKVKTNGLKAKIAVHKINGLKLKPPGLRGPKGLKDPSLKALRLGLRGLNKINDLKLPNNSLGL